MCSRAGARHVEAMQVEVMQVEVMRMEETPGGQAQEMHVEGK
jgi:hypothetical protein